MNILQTLWSALETEFETQRSFDRARMLVPIFYFFVEFMSFGVLLRFSDLIAREPLMYWGVSWVNVLGQYSGYALHVALGVFFVGTFAAAVWHRFRIARIAAFLSIFIFQAYMVSLDGQANEFYIPLFVSLLFIFLPAVSTEGDESLEKRRLYNLVFWGAQAYILLTYAQSGFYKITTTIWQASVGQSNFFTPDSAALLVAHWLVQYDNTTMLGAFVINHPYFGWIGLLAGLYVLVFAIWAAFVPSLHRIWAVGIILFHLSTVVSMGLLFWFNTFLVMLFLGSSPFTPRGITWRQIAVALPLFGPGLKWIFSRFAKR